MAAAPAAAAAAGALAAVAAAPPAAPPAVEDDSLIKEGDYVVFDEHGDKKSLVVIKRNGRAKVGKSLICTGDLIGAAWGSTYTLSAGSSHLVAITEHEPVSGPAVDAAEVERDNRDLVDKNSSQALTAADIEQMKASGKGGDEIIAALCKHSTTFEAKTEFAQEKYKKRKARKYLTRLTLKRPTGWTVCQVMFDKSPTSVWNLRPDSLALLLSLANVGAGARCLVLENCQGVVSGAVAERLGGYGSLCCLGTGGKAAPLSALGQMNLSPQHKGIVSATQLADMLAAAQRRAAKLAGSSDQQPPQQEQQQPASAAANGSAALSQEAAAAPSAAPQAAAAATSCAVEAALAGGSSLPSSSRSTPVVAAAAAGADAGGEEDLDDLYDKESAAPAAAGEGAAGEEAAANKRKHTSTEAGDGEEQQPEQTHKRQKQQQPPSSSQQGDVEMQDAQQQAPAEAATAGAQRQQGGNPSNSREGRVQHVTQPEAVDALLAGGFNSCIIACPKLQPVAILQQLLPLLEPSSSFVVFSPWVQPLAEAMAALTASRGAVMLQLQESWLRPYQVLPARTHPHMALTTGGTGGYILSGITTTGGGGGGEEGGEGDGEGDGEKRRGGGRGGRGRGGRGGRGGGGRGNRRR